MCTHTRMANAAVTFKTQQHISCCSVISISLRPSSFFFSLCREANWFPNGLPAIPEVGWRSVFFFPFHKKEIKRTWPGMLLMLLPINLSTSSVGYWIQYTFLCSNKSFKFLNIKGSKRKKFNFHRRDSK